MFFCWSQTSVESQRGRQSNTWGWRRRSSTLASASQAPLTQTSSPKLHSGPPGGTKRHFSYFNPNLRRHSFNCNGGLRPPCSSPRPRRRWSSPDPAPSASGWKGPRRPLTPRTASGLRTGQENVKICSLLPTPTHTPTNRAFVFTWSNIEFTFPA